MNCNISLDIDHTLAFHMVKDLPQANFFYHKGAVLSTPRMRTHYVYPGALELAKALFNTEEFKVSFNSKGLASRNKRFVREFLNQSMPEAIYKSQKLKVIKERIFSREHLVYEFDGSKKDLGLTIGEEDRIEDGVLIDDRPENALEGQESNLLYIPRVDWEDFDKLDEKREFYDSLGMRYLKCEFNIVGDCELEDNAVEEGRRIFIYKNVEGFEIKFLDLEGNVQIKNVSFHDHPRLYADLVCEYDMGIVNGGEISSINDKESVFHICQFVESFNGKAQKICRSVNRICYVAGLLFASLDYAKVHDTSLSHALFLHQYKEKNGVYQRDLKNERFYLEGLAKLKEVNPDFKLVTPDIYRVYNNIPLSDVDCEFLENALNNEFEFIF
jgi:hypothetical protein